MRERIRLPTNRAHILRNETCPYCGTELSAENITRDHVVGRRFVPRGSLDATWNLIVQACRKCNNYKSDLEDDLSAISMQVPLVGPQRDDDLLDSEARRKGAKSISRLTRRPVDASSEELTFGATFAPGAKVSASFTSPAQADPQRVYELVRAQLIAFFYAASYDEAKRRGFWWPGEFLPLQIASSSDWDNELQRTFMNAVRSWDTSLLGVTAAGYYRVAVRRHPEKLLWSWAVEWNSKLRIIGFFGDRPAAKEVCEQLTEPEMTPLGQDADGAFYRGRREVPLAEDDDTMFASPPHEQSNAD
jgi:hypothetical protein